MRVLDASDPAQAQVSNWIGVQDELKKRLITEDDFTWELPTSTSIETKGEKAPLLKYVGGVDISFSKEDPSIACGCLVVLDLQTMQIVYEDYSLCNLQVPYVPGFLAFREAPVLLQLLDNMKQNSNPYYPQILMVDGNGLLHPRGFGLACHLGILADVPTIGIGKNLHHMDGLTHSGVRQLLEAKESSSGDIITLTGGSGFIWGVAMRSNPDALKPIFISVGHRISLDTAVMIVKMTCKHRVPEPIRRSFVSIIFGTTVDAITFTLLGTFAFQITLEESKIGNLGFIDEDVGQGFCGKFTHLSRSQILPSSLSSCRRTLLTTKEADIRSRDYLQKHPMGHQNGATG